MARRPYATAMIPELAAAHTSLLGLAVGDAFGAMLDACGTDVGRRASKRLISMKRPWRWTDDTAMATAIVGELAARGSLDPGALATAFVDTWLRAPDRGYGAGAYSILARASMGADLVTEARALFRGTGSYGNGAAMRAAPIGAYFARDLDRVRHEALRSAEPTHAHPDGAAGAVAVAIAAALARLDIPRETMIARVANLTPPGPTRDGLSRAEQLGLDFELQLAAEELGTGSRILSRDTVPFSVWIAARHLRSYEDALWAGCAPPVEVVDAFAVCAVDRDTVGAIVGGIVACATGTDGIPLLWREATEPLAI